jgi:Tfp pilus assembly protein PilN
MIQFNLLPDIKIQYIRARRQKHLVVVGSTIAIVVSVVVIVLLVSTAFGLQRKSIADLSRDISAASKELQNTQDLTKMLTVQNQLKALPTLHDDKPVASRTFTFIAQVTPADVNISRLQADFTGQVMTISGTASALETVNTFADTLKFATFHTASAPHDELPAFNNVVLSTFGRDSKGASYTITLAFDKTLFSETEDVTLTVPNKITTRSQTEQPAALFQDAEGGQ